MSGAVILSCLIVGLVGACGTTSGLKALTPQLASYAVHGPFAVQTGDASWVDRGRSLTIHAHIYYPLAPGRHPLVIFSHGLGNSSRGYRYLGEHWASWGIITVHVEHPGAGADLARRGWLAIYRAGFDRRLWLTTTADVHFVLDQLLSGEGAPLFLRGNIDSDAIGVAGHSLGAYVALATAGAIHRLPGIGAAKLRDPRIRCAVALSMSENLPEDSYGVTSVPILHFTGTRDSSLFYGTTKAMRRIPFRETSGSPQMLVVLDGANHSTFSADNHSGQAERLLLIKATTLLWWKAWLEHDPSALRALSGVAVPLRLLHATVETKGLITPSAWNEGGRRSRQ